MECLDRRRARVVSRVVGAVVTVAGLRPTRQRLRDLAQETRSRGLVAGLGGVVQTGRIQCGAGDLPVRRIRILRRARDVARLGVVAGRAGGQAVAGPEPRAPITRADRKSALIGYAVA
ncbi:hypothetical protein SDC9_90742 [bioreactor metagenome]|uniref:Uncharacterized protein n=1 Tax=bioreactor metagenome TaxID=1076179 RepID=A0A645A2N5_9ZZZZ